MEGFLITGFRKVVPTDMDFYGTFFGGYVIVNVRPAVINGRTDFVVSVWGTDDTSLVRFFDTWEEALAVYNRTSYIQSAADLADFMYGVRGENNNGWPGARFAYMEGFRFPEPDDTPGWVAHPTNVDVYGLAPVRVY